MFSMSPKIIYEDLHFIVVNKPAGWLTHAAPRHAQQNAPVLVDWLLERYPEIKSVGDDPATRPGIVHRLDKDTSGALLIPRDQTTFEFFKKQFQNHEIKKTYLALVHGLLKQKEGTINLPIGLKLGTIKRTVHTKKAKMVKEAITKYKTLRAIPKSQFVIPDVDPESSPFTLLQVEPLTGRTHQIRVHLASIGHPIVGDQLYGSKKDQFPRLFLHADSLEFTAPSGNRLKISADPPSDLTDLIK